MSDFLELTPLSDFPVLPGSDEDIYLALSPTSAPDDGLPAQLDLDIDIDSDFFTTPNHLDVPAEDASPRQKNGSRKAVRQERQEQRKVKHRMIDRKRRMREKVSIEELKDLISMHPSDKPDKATIVASAVRTIKNLQRQIAYLEARQQPASSSSSSSSDHNSIKVEESGVPPPLSPLSSGLSISGVLLMIIDYKDNTIKQVNQLFETITGFRSDEVVGRRFDSSPLFGRYIIGDVFPHESYQQSKDPHQSLIPTASSEDYTSSHFDQLSQGLLSNGNWRVVCRTMTRSGYILESYSTLCLWRAAGQPLSIMHISTSEHRRFTIPSWLLAFPSSCQGAQKKSEVFSPVYVPQQS